MQSSQQAVATFVASAFLLLCLSLVPNALIERVEASSSSSSIMMTFCGDGTCNGAEECDGVSYCFPYDMGCSYFGAPYGNVTCNMNCTVNASACSMYDSSSSASPYCGDGMCNGTEDCTTCSAECGLCPSSSSSSIIISSSSSIGPVCGNNSCEYPSESCDGGDFCGANCGSFGFTDGVLTCGMGCTVDTSGCYNGSSSSSSVSSSSSIVGSSSSVAVPFFSWWSLPLLALGCAGVWWFQRDVSTFRD